MTEEVNSTPGLRGIERSTGLDIAERIIAFLEEHARAPDRRDAGLVTD